MKTNFIVFVFFLFSFSSLCFADNSACEVKDAVPGIKEVVGHVKLVVPVIPKVKPEDQTPLLTLTKETNPDNVLNYRAGIDKTNCTFLNAPIVGWWMGHEKIPYWKTIIQTREDAIFGEKLYQLFRVRNPYNAGRNDYYRIEIQLAEELSTREGGTLADGYVHFYIEKNKSGNGCDITPKFTFAGESSPRAVKNLEFELNWLGHKIITIVDEMDISHTFTLK